MKSKQDMVKQIKRDTPWLKHPRGPTSKGRWACTVRGCLFRSESYSNLIFHEENEHLKD